MAAQFKKATRAKVRLKILLTGPSGGGKTLGALYIADGLAPGKIALIDSEHDRSSYYADRIAFDSLALERHQPKDYIEALNAAVAGGYDVCVIDSLSHAWEDILDRKEAYDRANPRSNSWANWKTFGKEWDTLTRAILEAPIHVIATGRSKMAHEQQVGGDGKKTVVKLGLAPILRDSTEFDYALSFAIESTHAAFASKDNTGLFTGDDVFWDLTDGRVPAMLRQWIESAVEVERPTPATSQAIDDALLELPEAQQAKARMRIAVLRNAGFSETKAQEVLEQLRVLIGAPTATADSATTSEANTQPKAMTLSVAAAMTVKLKSGEVQLGECDDKVLAQIRIQAVAKQRKELLTAIDIVMADRAEMAAQDVAGEPPLDDDDPPLDDESDEVADTADVDTDTDHHAAMESVAL